MSFCDFVPDDESCQTDNGGDNNGNPNNSNAGGDMDDDMEHGNPMKGNLMYLHVAMYGAIHGALELFRYHEDTHYDNGDVLSTNWWKYTGELHHYSHFGIMSILTVTQILSMVGIAGEINIMAWMYAEMIETILSLLLKVVRIYGFDAYWSVETDTS